MNVPNKEAGERAPAPLAGRHASGDRRREPRTVTHRRLNTSRGRADEYLEPRPPDPGLTHAHFQPGSPGMKDAQRRRSATLPHPCHHSRSDDLDEAFASLVAGCGVLPWFRFAVRLGGKHPGGSLAGNESSPHWSMTASTALSFFDPGEFVMMEGLLQRQRLSTT